MMSKVLAIGMRREKMVWKKVFSPGVMVWAGIRSRGTTTIHFCEKNVDSQYYQRILNENYLPFHQQGFILMQDNATPHTSQSTLKFLEDKNIDVLEWAPHSPDCNHIEHLWAIIVRRIYEGGKEYRTIEDLKNAIKIVWEDLEIELISKTSHSSSGE